MRNRLPKTTEGEEENVMKLSEEDRRRLHEVYTYILSWRKIDEAAEGAEIDADHKGVQDRTGTK